MGRPVEPYLRSVIMVGVYRILNTVSDTAYIGSAVCVTTRLYEHRRTLKNGKHENMHLQRAWNKYGECVFVFEPLLECSLESRRDREQRFIDAYLEHGLSVYNMPAARQVSEETRSLQSRRRSEYWQRKRYGELVP